MSADPAASKRALLVGLLGVGCYPLSLLGALLGLRAFLSLSAPGTPGRALAIVAMLMPGLVLPATFLEAALAKTPLRRSQVAKLQPECRQQLAKIWAAEERFHAENGRYTEDPSELEQLEPPPQQRYTYVFGTHAWLVHDDQTATSHLAQLKKQNVQTGQGDDAFRVACITLLKDWADVWTVSSEDRELEGGKALLPAGTPHQDYSGYAR